MVLSPISFPEIDQVEEGSESAIRDAFKTLVRWFSFSVVRDGAQLIEKSFYIQIQIKMILLKWYYVYTV